MIIWSWSPLQCLVVLLSLFSLLDATPYPNPFVQHQYQYQQQQPQKHSAHYIYSTNTKPHALNQYLEQQQLQQKQQRSFPNWRNVLRLPNKKKVSSLPFKQHSDLTYVEHEPSTYVTHYKSDNSKESIDKSLYQRRHSLAYAGSSTTASSQTTNTKLQDVHRVRPLSTRQIRTEIIEHRARLQRLRQELKDLSHERTFLSRTLALKKGQKTIQDGQVRLSQAELADKENEIAMYKREAPRTLQRYNDLMKKQRDLQDTLSRLHIQSEHLSKSKEELLGKIQNLKMEDFIDQHMKQLPNTLSNTIKKSINVLIPFVNYLIIASNTNNKLVNHVSNEIDKYTNINITNSPFMNGILYYCILLIPILTIFGICKILFFNQSMYKFTIVHFLILGNIYFIFISLLNFTLSFILTDDPLVFFFVHHQNTFIVMNLLLAIYYTWHLAMLFLSAALKCNHYNISQLFATLCVGIHYFLFSWRNIFTDKEPHMYTFNYLIYATIFIIVLHERWNRLTTRQIVEVPLFAWIDRFLFNSYYTNLNYRNNAKSSNDDDGNDDDGGDGGKKNNTNTTITTGGINFNIGKTVEDLLRFLTMTSKRSNQKNSGRKFSRKHDRVLVSDAHTGRSGGLSTRERERERQRERQSERERERQRVRSLRSRNNNNYVNTSGNNTMSITNGGIMGAMGRSVGVGGGIEDASGISSSGSESSGHSDNEGVRTGVTTSSVTNEWRKPRSSFNNNNFTSSGGQKTKKEHRAVRSRTSPTKLRNMTGSANSKHNAYMIGSSRNNTNTADNLIADGGATNGLPNGRNAQNSIRSQKRMAALDNDESNGAGLLGRLFGSATGNGTGNATSVKGRDRRLNAHMMLSSSDDEDGEEEDDDNHDNEDGIDNDADAMNNGRGKEGAASADGKNGSTSRRSLWKWA